MRVTDRFLESANHSTRPDEAAPRRKHWIHQRPKSPTTLELSRHAFKNRSVATVRPNSANVSSHARSGNAVDLNAVFFQDLDHTNVRETFRAAGGERQSNAAAANLPGKPSNVEFEPMIPDFAVPRKTVRK